MINLDNVTAVIREDVNYMFDNVRIIFPTIQRSKDISVDTCKYLIASVKPITSSSLLDATLF